MTNPPWPERGSDESDIDAAFAAIVAGWDLEADPAQRPNRLQTSATAASERDPADPDANTPAGGAAPNATPPQAVPGALPANELPAARPEPRRPAFDVAPSAWRVHVPPEDAGEDDEFHPPDPPLPRGDVRYWLAVTGLVLGPLVLIAWVLTGPHSTNLPLVLAGLVTVAGFGALISRLPDRHDEDDDGARV